MTKIVDKIIQELLRNRWRYIRGNVQEQKYQWLSWWFVINAQETEVSKSNVHQTLLNSLIYNTVLLLAF